MSRQPYCGRCHKWVDEQQAARTTCSEECRQHCHCANPDLTRDPNCHNSGHAHYDPESPIVKMDRRVDAINVAAAQNRTHIFWREGEQVDCCEFCGIRADEAELGSVNCPGRDHAWVESIERGQRCVWCDADIDDVGTPLGCPQRPPRVRLSTPEEMAQYREIGQRTYKPRPGPQSLDEGYDAHRINWPRLIERVLASVINAIFYGSLLVLAKLIGLM